MSVNVFIESSILNTDSSTAQILYHYLRKHVKNPKVRLDVDNNLFIDEDFDRRHIECLLYFLEKHNPKIYSREVITLKKRPLQDQILNMVTNYCLLEKRVKKLEGGTCQD